MIHRIDNMMTGWSTALQRSPLFLISLCLPWLVLLGWLAAVAWFLCDDAFISFRYVRNLLEGHGLVFNPGEYVEGYTNLLWVLELAAIWRLSGIPPEQAATWLSVVCTAGTIEAMLWWVMRLPGVRHRGLVAWMALGLLCSSATFAVWTSGGGLETRQFTFFTVLAVVLLSLYRDRRRGLAVASLSLALAAYTRPEGLLIGALCIGWFVVQLMVDASPERPAGGRLRPDWRRLAWLAMPFAALVAAHYLFRYGYYGEWLPNTYYAKHVRPWYESGFRYLWAAALETGLYLLLPLAAVAMRHHWRSRRDGAFALVLLLVGVHMIYVMRVGGDHFEYRPLDFYWPLLAVPAALGIVRLGSRLAARRWLPSALGRMGARTFAVALFVPVLFYTSAIQGTLLFAGAASRERISNRYIELDHDNAGWLLATPAMPMLVAISNDLRRLAAPQLVASPFAQHREFARKQLRNWKPYENMERGVIPEDALMFDGVVGIRFYYLPDLKVIDRYGLTDATVARNPVTRPNRERVIAHDRWPPSGYFEERGVNFTIRPPESSASAALASARYAVKIGAGLWMPFNSPDRQWVLERFGDRDLRMRKENAPRLRPPGLEPVIRSNFDIYFTGKSLVYEKQSCRLGDVKAPFFVHVFPMDRNDLPERRRQFQFDNLDFRFRNIGQEVGGTCFAVRHLPEYPIATIRTGQHTGGGRVWEGSFDIAGQACDGAANRHAPGGGRCGRPSDPPSP